MKGEMMSKTDIIEKFDNATIHHGKFNNRLYILKFPPDGEKNLIKAICKKAIKNEYTKITGKVPRKTVSKFLKNGFKIEAVIPRFYKGINDCYFVSKFLDKDRAVFDPGSLNEFKKVLDSYEAKPQVKIEHNYDVRQLNADDVNDITELYREVFDSYPFPIHEDRYIIETMKSHVIYYGIYVKGKLLSISSAEMDIESKNAEMTDFAVSNDARGLGLSKILLQYMEDEMKKKEMNTLYTIARLESIPMNKTFMGAGYSFAGTLINNTNISGGIESMNVWYKYV
jgi:putative beta-lysine N-acetyltransferase